MIWSIDVASSDRIPIREVSPNVRYQFELYRSLWGRLGILGAGETLFNPKHGVVLASAGLANLSLELLVLRKVVVLQPVEPAPNEVELKSSYQMVERQVS